MNKWNAIHIVSLEETHAPFAYLKKWELQKVVSYVRKRSKTLAGISRTLSTSHLNRRTTVRLGYSHFPVPCYSPASLDHKVQPLGWNIGSVETSQKQTILSIGLSLQLRDTCGQNQSFCRFPKKMYLLFLQFLWICLGGKSHKAAVSRVWGPGCTGSLLAVLSALLTCCRQSRGAAQAEDGVSVRSALPLCWLQFKREQYHLAQRLKQQVIKTRPEHHKVWWQPLWHSHSCPRPVPPPPHLSWFCLYRF